MKDAPEIDLNGEVIEVPERDLWGNPIVAPMFPVKKSVSAIQKRASPMAGPASETCGTCNHLITHKSSPTKTYFKCGLVWNRKRSEASDIRKKHNACQKWEPKKPIK